MSGPLSDIVKIAMRSVHTCGQGREWFVLRADAEAFSRAIYDAYPAAGYGTSVTIKSNGTGNNCVQWYVWSAD